MQEMAAAGRKWKMLVEVLVAFLSLIPLIFSPFQVQIP